MPRVFLVYYTYTQQSLRVVEPPPLLKPDYSEQAEAFANELADGLGDSGLREHSV